MSSRGRPAFRPTSTLPLGVDALECRQLLSAVIEPAGTAPLDRVAAVVVWLPASPSDAIASTSPASPTAVAGYLEVAVGRGVTTGSSPATSEEGLASIATATTVALEVQVGAPAAEKLASVTTDSPAILEVHVTAAVQRDLTTGSGSPNHPPAGPLPIGGHANAAADRRDLLQPGTWRDPGTDSDPNGPPPGPPPDAMTVFVIELLRNDDGPGGPIAGRSPEGSPSDADSMIGAGIDPSRGDDLATPVAPDARAVETVAGPISMVFRGGMSARPVNTEAPTGANAAAVGLPANEVDATVLDADSIAGIPMDGATGSTAEVAGSVGDGDSIVSSAGEESALFPRCADLLTEFLPFDRASLEDAVDRFLEPLRDIGSELVRWESPRGLIPATLAVAAGAVAWEVARRKARAEAAGRGEQEDDLAPLPVDPAAWSLEG